MEVKLERIDDNYHFLGKGLSDISVRIDGSEKIGGKNAGARPMELILMGLGSCAAMDIVSMLKKKRQDLKQLKINVHGERDNNKIPAVFTNIDVQFILFGNLDENKVSKVINLATKKYCSVSAMLEKSVKINYSFQIKEDV